MERFYLLVASVVAIPALVCLSYWLGVTVTALVRGQATMCPSCHSHRTRWAMLSLPDQLLPDWVLPRRCQSCQFRFYAARSLNYVRRAKLEAESDPPLKPKPARGLVPAWKTLDFDRPDLDSLRAAATLVHAVIPPTPQIRWPLLCARAGADVWVKHENHTPVGAFKLRGGLVYFDQLRSRQPDIAGVVSATRGNHGQSIAFCAALHGLRAVIVVPRGNSREKNAAMRALGAELIESGRDFQEAIEHATRLAAEQSLHFVPSFAELLVRGVATCSLELLEAVPGLDAVYVPIGLGSGGCGAIASRDALGLATEIVGVVAAAAPAYATSFASGQPISAEVSPTVADGMTCRVPDPIALEKLRAGLARIVTVDESDIRGAMRHLFTDTHNTAEGAGAAALAALLKERDRMRGRRVAVIQTGGNVDSEVFAQVLAEPS